MRQFRENSLIQYSFPVPTLVESLEKELECSICLDMYRDPKTLPCLHTFCCECLNELAEKRKNQEPISCPDCRTEIELPQEGTFDTFPSAFYLNRLRDIVSVQRQENQVMCRSCGKRSQIVAFCFDCQCFVCAECRDLHSKLLITKSHRMTEIGVIQDAEVQEILRAPQHCREKYHDNTAFQYFCKTCLKCICQICTTILHKNHNLVHLKEAAEEVKPRLIETENKIQARGGAWEGQMNAVKDAHKQLKEQFETSRRAICQNTKRYIELARRRERELLSELDALEKAQDKKFENQTEKAKLLLGQLNSITEYLRSVSQRGISEEILDAEPCASSRTQEVLDAMAQFQPLDGVFVDFQPDEVVYNHVEKLPVGRINVQFAQEIQTRLEASQIAQIEETVTSGVKDLIDNVCTDSSSEQVQAQSLPRAEENLGSEAEHSKEDPNTPTSLDVHVTKKRPRGYKVVATFGSRRGGKSRLNGPVGISVSSTGEIAVSDYLNHRVELFSADGEYESEFGKRGNARDQLNYPRGLAWSEAGHIIVADQCNSRIQVFSSTGELIKNFGQDSLKEPCGIFLTSDGSTVVCDSKTRKVNKFTHEGKLLQQFLPCGTQASPLHVTLWHDKYFVSVTNHVIKVFDSHGSHLYDIGREGSADGHFKSPRGLAVDADDLLLVCDHSNHRVQVVKPDGEFVTSFGSRGSGEGQFNRPQDIAVSPDGRVFVTDYGNHRIQVFQAQY